MAQSAVDVSDRRVTLADVANEAGVSIATASKALSGRQKVSPSAKQRVLAAANQLAFHPNRQAQNLALGRSGTVGLVTHDLEGRFSIPIMLGAEDTFGVGKVSVMLCDARGDALREEYHIGALLGRQVDGLIIVGARPDPRPSLGKLPVPVVYAYAPSDDPEDMSVIADNHEAGRLAARHLLDMGRQKIAAVSGDVTYGAAIERTEGAEEVLSEAGLEFVAGGTRYGSWTESWGRAATQGLISSNEEFDALLCGSDQVARGAVDALRENGRKIPEDVAVVGCDNWEAFSLGSRPPLTSVDLRLENLGQRAAAILLEAMDGTTRNGTEVVSCQIVVRGSTAA